CGRADVGGSVAHAWMVRHGSHAGPRPSRNGTPALSHGGEAIPCLNPEAPSPGESSAFNYPQLPTSLFGTALLRSDLGGGVRPWSVSRRGGTDMDVWVEGELDGCDFPDQRLKDRLGRLLGDLGRRIGGTIPAACQDWAATKAAYRFFSNPRVDEA